MSGIYQNHYKTIRSEKGFSLTELMTVKIVMAILVGLAVAVYNDVSNKPASEAHKANVRTLISSMHIAISDFGSESFTVTSGDPVWHKNSPAIGSGNPCWADYLHEWPVVPSESDYNGEYVVYLDYPGPSVRVETE